MTPGQRSFSALRHDDPRHGAMVCRHSMALMSLEDRIKIVSSCAGRAWGSTQGGFTGTIGGMR